MRKNTSRLAVLLSLLAVYAIVSTSFVTRSLIGSLSNRFDVEIDEVINFEETGDGSEREETDDEAGEISCP